MARMIAARLKEMTRGIVDRGLERPRANRPLFRSSPKNIVKEMLRPTDSTNIVGKSSLPSFRMSSKIKPGIKARKAKPKICLRKGISSSIAAPVRATNAIIKLAPLAGDKLISRSVISLSFQYS